MVMVAQGHLGFALANSKIYSDILIPKYYDPEILRRLEKMKSSHQLTSLGELIEEKHLLVTTGDEIGKMAYGTGDIPFIRTSDIGNWEIKADPKQGISTLIYEQYGEKQDIQSGDLLFVRDGTYLIGQTCLITSHDLPCLIQSHILKFRVNRTAPWSAGLIMACLNCPIVKRQIRSKQFTADIIDTIGNRYQELVLPFPKDAACAMLITAEIQENVDQRALLREKIRKIPLWAEGIIADLDKTVPTEWIWRLEIPGNPGFALPASQIKGGIFVPKYYDPKLEKDLEKLSKTHELVSLGKLAKAEQISWDTGIEVGKMAYGTGTIPFIRTSDLSNWELKGDPKQSVSAGIYEANKQDVLAEDIFVVRDGTYLVGSSCILTEHDTRILYCGGVYKFRVMKKEKLDPYLLLALLNTPIVRRQMRSKQFTRDIIDTLGKRIFEVVLPIPKDKKVCQRVAAETREVIETRVRLRNRAKEIALEVEGIERPRPEDLEALEEL